MGAILAAPPAFVEGGGDARGHVASGPTDRMV
jgi:hypothetical protein